jgi:hypothetical protein
MPNFIPLFDFIPFTGVVEENKDPLHLGRLRVRIHGYYSDDPVEVPTNTLPWANVQYSTSTSMNIPNIGEWVFGMFLDGKEAQKPMVIGVLPGVDGEEPSTSRFVRNENVSSTNIQQSKSNTTSLRSISEPTSPYNATYPENTVIQTKSHIIEIDDTEDSERIHIYHKSGTFDETHPNGSRVSKTVGNRFEINRSDNYTITLGDDIQELQGTMKIENSAGAVIEMNRNGLIEISNKSNSLHNILNDILNELTKLRTVGSPSTQTVSPGNIINFIRLIAEMKTLLK